MNMDGRPHILTILHALSTARSLEEAEAAFTAFCAEDLGAAEHMAAVLATAAPNTASLWQTILDWAKEHQAGAERPKPFEWEGTDAADTADKLAAHVGWHDMERREA